MRLRRVPQPFDHQDFIYELKFDGFRALALIEDGQCRLVSRNGHEFGRWEALKVRSRGRCSAALPSSMAIACFDPDGRSNFYALLFRRRSPYFCAFAALSIDRQNLRRLPLLERKRRLLELMPQIEARVRYVEHIHERGTNFFHFACSRDLEGIVGKYANGRYQADGVATSWLKIETVLQSDGRSR